MEWFSNNWETIILAICCGIGIIYAIITKSISPTEALGKLFSKMFSSKMKVTGVEKLKLSTNRYDTIKSALSNKKNVETVLDDIKELFDNIREVVAEDEPWLAAILNGYYLYISSDVTTLYNHRDYALTIINAVYDVVDE